jgi:glycosyltransferase involved in cell wall biosynthesis
MYQTADPGMYLEPHTFDEKMKEPTIVFMGDVYFRDGIDVAVKALKLVKKEMPKIKLVITGGGPYVPNVLSLARRLDVMEDIQLTGWLSFDDLLVLLQRAALGLVPWRDSLANRIVIPEKTYGYMAAGTPVVASKLKAIQEIIEHKKTGVLVTPEDPCELADGILSILGCRRFYEEIQSHARDAMLSHNRSVAKLTAEIFDSKKYFR